MATDRPVYVVELRADDPQMTGPDTIRALRSALKVLLRRFRLRAEKIVPKADGKEPTK